MQQFVLVISTGLILLCGSFLWLLTHHICSVALRVVTYSSVGLVCGVSWYSLNSYREYYTVAWRYEFYFRVAKQHFTYERSELSKIKFKPSSRRVMFFLLHRQNDIYIYIYYFLIFYFFFTGAVVCVLRIGDIFPYWSLYFCTEINISVQGYILLYWCILYYTGKYTRTANEYVCVLRYRMQ